MGPRKNWKNCSEKHKYFCYLFRSQYLPIVQSINITFGIPMIRWSMEFQIGLLGCDTVYSGLYAACNLCHRGTWIKAKIISNTPLNPLNTNAVLKAKMQLFKYLPIVYFTSHL